MVPLARFPFRGGVLYICIMYICDMVSKDRYTVDGGERKRSESLPSRIHRYQYLSHRPGYLPPKKERMSGVPAAEFEILLCLRRPCRRLVSF